MKSKLFFVVGLVTVFFIATTASAQQEEITLSTYYPAPFGEYDELCAEKLLVDLPSAAELQDMARGDCHITRSLIVGTAGGGFSYDALNAAGTPLYDGDVIIEGSVGIGTTNPGSKLSLGPSSNEQKLRIWELSPTEYLGIGVTTAGLFAFNLDQPTNRFGFFNDETLGTELLTIQGTGNVGIGTTNPGAKLEIRDGLLLLKENTPSLTSAQNPPKFALPSFGIALESGASPSTDTTIPIVFRAFNAGSMVQRAIIAMRTSGNFGELSFHTQWGADGQMYERMRIDSAGNVGIGTTTPRTILHIKDPATSQPNGLLIENNSGGAVGGRSPRVELVDTSVGGIDTAPLWAIHNWQDAFGIFRQPNIYTAGIEHLHISNNGNVGIGTTAPGTWKLFVNNESGAALLNLRTGYDNGRNLQIGYDDPLKYWAFNTDAAGGFRFNGNVSKQSGGFDIPHPVPVKEKEDWHLKHSFVESPTRGDNLYRWTVEVKDGEVTIELPDYFKYLNENVQVWVSPKRHFGRAYGEADTELTKITLKADSDGAYNVLAVGTRKDRYAKGWFDKLGVEYQAIAKE